MHWRIKGTIQRTLSQLPCGSACNYFLQRTVGGLRHNSGTASSTFEADAVVILNRIARLRLDPGTTRVMEIGTGWMPVVPLSLYLAGFQHILTVDLNRYLRVSGAERTLLGLEPFLQHRSLTQFADQGKIRERYERALALFRSKRLADLPVSYRAPFDASKTDFASESFDLVLSNNVFEHVPQGVLAQIFGESRRLLRPGGSILHCINCGDHYAYFDPKISQANYLQFSEREWARWNNPLHYQNRLRPIDFIEMADKNRFQVRSAEFESSAAALRQLENMEIAPEFRHYPLEQLAATSLTLIASA